MKKQQTAIAQQRPLYVLPQDLPEVRIMAHAQALENAFQVLYQRLDLGEAAIRYMATVAMQEHLQRKQDGKRGTNDVSLFGQVFIESFLQRYPEALSALKNGAVPIAPSPVARAIGFIQYARDMSRTKEGV